MSASSFRTQTQTQTQNSDGTYTAADGRSLRRQRNAERLYDAASELLADHDFEDLSVDDICSRAEVGRATFFRIYGTKVGLLREFNRRLAADAAARIEQHDTTDVRVALEHVRQAINDAWRDAGRGHVGMASAFVRTVPNANPHAAHPELLGLVTHIVTDAVERGELPSTIPVQIAASLALLHLVSPIAYTLGGREVDIDQLSKTLLEQWLAGMTAIEHSDR